MFKEVKSYVSLNWDKSIKHYVLIASILFANSLHIMYFSNDDMYDVYFFYSHKRYLTNILYDIGNIYSANALLYIASKYKRNIFKPLYLTSLAMWLTYFTFYNQMASLLLIPFYLCTVILTRKKQQDK